MLATQELSEHEAGSPLRLKLVVSWCSRFDPGTHWMTSVLLWEPWILPSEFDLLRALKKKSTKIQSSCHKILTMIASGYGVWFFIIVALFNFFPGLLSTTTC